VPPAIETWAPRRSGRRNREAGTGAAIRASRCCSRSPRRASLGTRPVPFSRLGLEVRRSPSQPSSTLRTMQRRRLVARLQRVVVRTPAAAGAFQGLVAADDAKRIVLRIVAKPAAHHAAFGKRHRPRSHFAGSMAGPPWRTSKCRCGGSSGSEIPTPPMTCPLITLCPSRTSARASEP
jgi:hypothetical protein